jgi:hypothetical protein
MKQKLPFAGKGRGNLCSVRHVRILEEVIMPKAPRKAAKPRPTGRPAIDVSPDQVRILASYAHTLPEIAAVCGVSLRTLNRRMKQKEFADAFAQGEQLATAEIKTLLFKFGRKGSARSLIFLANNLMGWSDKVSSTVENTNFVVEIPAPLNLDEWTQVYGNGKPAIDVTPKIENAPEKP